MAMITSKTIDVNGIRMHVTEGGAAPVRAFQSGKAPVFLLSRRREERTLISLPPTP